jgi:pimeloyl-ACP methyl ester carboxylesterase
MANFVLVHGAWIGGWYWRPIAQKLRAAGHEAYAPTLTGLGERIHLMNPSINLDTHVTDVVNVIKEEGLSDVVLVGHSYGGMVVTGVADALPDKITSLVYLDAFVPKNGEALVNFAARRPPLRANIRWRPCRPAFLAPVRMWRLRSMRARRRCRSPASLKRLRSTAASIASGRRPTSIATFRRRRPSRSSTRS